MRAQVEVMCATHPCEEIESALRSAGKALALREDSVLVEVREDERLTAVLEFEMPRSAKSRAADKIYTTVKNYAAVFYEDILIRFPKD